MVHTYMGYLVISANFEETLYRAQDRNELIAAPKLTLSRPSLCDFIIHAQLVPLGELFDICTYIYG